MTNYSELLREFLEKKRIEEGLETIEEMFEDLEIDEAIDHAYMMTQYEQGYIDFEGYAREVFYNNYDAELSWYNDYCMDNKYYDNEIYSMDDFDEDMSCINPHDLALKIFNGDFNPNDDYYKYNGYGNLVSLSDYDIKEELDDNDFIDWVIENREDYDLEEIDKIYDNKDILIDMCEYLVELGY